MPFYGYDRPGAPASGGVRQNWWRQGMMGGVLAQHECIRAFLETDFTEDLKALSVPTLIMHADAAPLSHALVRSFIKGAGRAETVNQRRRTPS